MLAIGMTSGKTARTHPSIDFEVTVFGFFMSRWFDDHQEWRSHERVESPARCSMMCGRFSGLVPDRKC